MRLFHPFEFEKAELHPDVSMMYLKGFSVIAYPCDEELPPSFWNKYNAEKRSLRLSGGETTEDLHWDTRRKGKGRYFGNSAA